MIRIELDAPTVARTRIATSPLWEVVCSLHLLDRWPSVPWPYARWAATAREVLRDPRTAAVGVQAAVGGISPDFLAPIPTGPSPSLAAELAVLRATPASVVAAQLAKHHPDGDVPPPLIPFRDDPAAAFDGLADAVAAYWDGAIAPYWPTMRSVLEEEVLYRARELARAGADALLAGLHDRVRWEPPVLTLVKPSEHSFEARESRLLLIPLVFSRGALMCSTDDPDTVAVSYQARGVAALEQDPRAAAPPGDRLGMLLGRGRAAVLRELAEPATTATLATRLGLAPSTVSEHLAGLVGAGVVARHRAGRRVLYSLDGTGAALLDLLDGDATTRRTA